MYTGCNKSTASLKLIDNRIVIHRLPIASCADLTTESGNFLIEAATDCLRAVSDGMIIV